MDLTRFFRPQALDGKYFIIQLKAQQATMLMRGRILGPIAGVFSSYYLCDLYPVNAGEIGIASQTILSLDQLRSVYLYEDKATQDAAWGPLHQALTPQVDGPSEEEGEVSSTHGPVMIRTAPPDEDRRGQGMTVREVRLEGSRSDD